VAFDIFGEPVNLALLLQKTAPANTLQISDTTHNHLEPVGYSMSRRTLVVDKREFVTYLLRGVGSSSNAA
jgi:class 3 adenylate cyclase